MQLRTLTKSCESMFGAFFHLTDRVIKKFAKQYVKTIQIDSLPLWKGQATIDDININTDGVNEAIAEGGGTVKIDNLTISRLSVKAPIFSPGTQPILINLHSADLRLSILPENPSENGASSQQPQSDQVAQTQSSQTSAESSPQVSQPQPAPDNTSFIAKLTSNILICVDGVFIQLEYNGFDIKLLASNLEIHIFPDQTKITAKNLRGNAHNEKTNLKLNLDELVVDIHSGESQSTLVDIKNLTAKIADTMEDNPHIFDLVDSPISLHLVFEGPNVTVQSDSDNINLTFDLDSLPSVIDIVQAFAVAEPDDSFEPLPNLTFHLPSVTANVNINNSLGLVLKIVGVEMANGRFEVGSISAFIRAVDDLSTLIDEFRVRGTLKQIEKVTYVTAQIESLRISLDLQKDILNLLKSIVIPKIELPPKPPPKKAIFTSASIPFSDLPNLKISQRIVDFMFDEPVVPILFTFDKCVQRAKLQLRVWNGTFKTFIAMTSFEPTSQICTFRLPDNQMIPGTRWQLIFPEPLSSFPSFIEGSTIHYQTCEKLRESVSIKADIGNIVASLSSYNFPIAGVSISGITADVDLSPFDIVKVNASLGIAVMLTNFRNSTMSSVLDIPKLAVQFNQFPDIISLINPDSRLSDALSAFPLQDSYASNSSSVNVRIPSINVNAVPTTIFDLIKFFETFSVSKVVAYKVVNKSDVPFHYQISESSDIVTIKPREEKSVTFKPNQLHFIKFPTFQTNIIFNSTGNYHISEINYIEVQATSPFSFTTTILSSVQLINKLKTPLELSMKSTSLSYLKVLQDSNDIGTTSMSNEKFTLKLRLPDSTDWSTPIEIDPNYFKAPILVTCDILNMLPQCYLCSPNFSCWIKFNRKELYCKNGQKHTITEFTFVPILSFKNHLDMHIISSLGTIPPRTSLYLSSIPNNQIVIENDHTIDLRLPLKASKPLNLLIHGTPAIVDTIPTANSIVVSPSFVFKNETTIRLLFKFNPEDKIIVEPNESIPLSLPRDPDWLSIGMEDKDGYSWSPPIQIPTSRDFTIRTSTGNLILFATITEYSVLITPKTVAINESDLPIIMKPSVKIDPDSQSQLLLWRGSQFNASFGFSKNAGFTKPIPLTSNLIWKRKFVMNEPGQSLFYLTYSIQTAADPNAIIFHRDPSPPFTIVNNSSLNFVIYYKKYTIISASQTTVYLPAVPDVLAFGRVGVKPFTVSLQFPADSFVDSQSSPIYVRVEKRGNQTRATVSQTILPKIVRSMRTHISAFISDFKLKIFDDFSEPGITKHAMTVTLSPLSANVMLAPGQETAISATIDTLEIDQLVYYERFPVLIRKVMPNMPLLSLSASIINSYGGGIVLNKVSMNLQPLQLCIEECFVRFILQLVSLIPPPPEDKSAQLLDEKGSNFDQRSSPVKLTPLYINFLDIKETRILISLATESIIHADFRNVPINLSPYRLKEIELFDVSLVQGIVSHYISDGLAAIPSLIGSLSLIGNPANIINQSLVAIKDFYRTAFFQGDSVIHGIGRGSMNIVRGVTMGTLESFVGLTYSLEKSISKLKPNYNQENTEEENRIGQEMAMAVSGLVTTPIREFSEDGLVGLARGAGKGVLGLVSVPTTALFCVLKNAGVTLLQKVGGKEDDIEDNRIENTMSVLPTLRLDDNDDDNDDDRNENENR